MSDSVEIEKARFSSEVINTICEAHPKNVRLKKVVSSEAILLKGKVFSDMEIASSKFKDALTFMDCRFNGHISLRQIKAGGQVSFINCEFLGDVTLFGSEVSGPISFIGNRIAGRLVVNGNSTPKLDIQSVSAKELSVKAEEVNSRIQNFIFKKISISGVSRIDNIAAIQSIDICDSASNTIQLRQLGLEENACINVNKSRINEVVFDDLRLNKSKVCFNSTLGENLYIRNCELEQASLAFEQVMIHGMFAIKHCSYHDAEIDMSSLTSPNLDLDDDLIDFVLKKGKNRSAIYADSLSVDKRVQTLKLLKDKFTQEHRYDLEDAVFYLLKNLECSHAIQQAKWWQKPLLCILYFLNRLVMGWGVRLRNSLVSALSFVGIWSVAYYITLGLYDADKYIEYLGQRLNGISGATTYSVLAFFGQQADAKIFSHVPISLALSEFIFGIAITTIIVGILIRKLVR